MELGHPETVGPARRIPALVALANLCAQAAHGNPAHVEGILAKAIEFRNQLATALRAAELMLLDVEAGRCSSSSSGSESESPMATGSPTIATSPPVALSSRKGYRSSR